MGALNAIWRLALALAVLFLVLVAAVLGTRSRQIYDVTWIGRAGAASATSPMHR
jgi:lipopolysaccharide export LptBFGC system permease protein LptF